MSLWLSKVVTFARFAKNSLTSFAGGFDRYVPFVMRMLIEASQAKFDHVDFGTIDYLNALRLSILDTYTGIIAGLADGGKVHDFSSFSVI